ncbi:hypothetical protein TNCV_346561 [Trichonephila clavipes]|nr:hypothetical protein TNCV_346561 [Trichonephila clavipes]
MSTLPSPGFESQTCDMEARYATTQPLGFQQRNMITKFQVTIGIAFQASITVEVSACSEEGRFVCALIRPKGVLWDLDLGSEKVSLVFEHPFRQSTFVKASMCEWSSYPAGREMVLPRNIAIELGVQYCPECPHTSQSSCF